MKNPTPTKKSKPGFPRRAYLCRITPLNGYTDAVCVQAVNVVELKKDRLTAVCYLRTGSIFERREIPFAELASTPGNALAKLHELLTELEARPLQHEVAGMTATGPATS